MAATRLLALDLDGTLLRDDGSIDPLDLAALERVRAAGCAVTIATGRMTTSTLPIARALQLDTPVVCADGRILAHARTGATLQVHAAPRRVDALAIFREHDLASLCFTPSAVVHDAHADRWLGVVSTADERRTAGFTLVTESADQDDTVIVLGLGERAAALAAHAAIEARLGDEVHAVTYVIGTGPHAVRVCAPGHDKQTALVHVAEMLGIEREHVAAVGDWYNDIGMLRWAGRSFAMHGAPPSVSEAASETLDANIGMGGGVAEAIRRWLG